MSFDDLTFPEVRHVNGLRIGNGLENRLVELDLVLSYNGKLGKAIKLFRRHTSQRVPHTPLVASEQLGNACKRSQYSI
jgi:hypothetical protein